MVLVGLGSNEGDSAEILQEAVRAIGAYALAGSLKVSSMWQTSPVDCPPGSGDFINAVVAFRAADGLTPEALLQSLKALERQHGRGVAYVKNAPRVLDLDLLTFNEEIRDTPDFVLPHPRALERLFVLAPAMEVAPLMVWPGTSVTIQTWYEQLQSDEQVRKFAD